MKLYTYFRSSAAYRVRIALNLKEVEHDMVPVHLVKQEHLSENYKLLNPQGLLPSLVDGGHALTQSMAILEYLEEEFPDPAILPQNSLERARVRALANVIACDVHPVNNLRVLKYLTNTLGMDEGAKMAWYRHWIAEGFAAFEEMIAGHPDTGNFCHGDSPTMADLCLVPQVYNAERFSCDMAPYPTIRSITATCLKLDAFDKARPENQPDCETPT